ncbi:MAG: zinc-dependent metalloprotease, partial [Planctomycetes bacterium]|nr:zinc-dependent metalloprotease [Planctomycetota bacterium]
MLTHVGRRLLLLGVVCAWCTAPVPAANAQGEDSLDIKAMISSMGEAMSGSTPGGDGKLPDFEKVTKDMVSKEGMFILWSYPPGTKDKDSEKLLAQIPTSFLGEKFMLSTSFSGGGFFTGFPLDERVVQWELADKQLVLIEPDTRFVVNKGQEVSDVVSRTYPDRIRVAVPLVTKSPSGDPVIDLGKLLKSDFADIGWMTALGRFFGQSTGGGVINSGLSKWARTPKTFPLNVEIGVALAVSRSSPPGSYDKKIVHYSFWKLPSSNYQPRVADDRVGYFLTTNQDWSKPNDARDIFNRYVNRWHLVKRDPSLTLCEPKQPIIFYIEKTVPVKYRRAVRDGILEWNKAYEKLGFVNAIEVRQQTADNEWKDLDPEDMRHSFFRWIVAGVGFAMGPSRANPFTGQIYDADIIFDDAMVRYFEQSAERMLAEGVLALHPADPALERFLEAYPQWRRPTRPWEQFRFGDSQDPRILTAVRARMQAKGHHLCDYAEGMKHQMTLAHSMLAGQPKEVMERFLYDIIKEVVMHEVGHTIGLRHNFKASSIWSVAEIQRRKEAGEATTGSVMDYNPILFFAKNATDGNFVTPTIGPYDYWAIEYGYRPVDGNYKSPTAEDDAKEEASTETEAKTEVSGGSKLFDSGSTVHAEGA